MARDNLMVDIDENFFLSNVFRVRDGSRIAETSVIAVEMVKNVCIVAED